jgi:hypothetical protein
MRRVTGARLAALAAVAFALVASPAAPADVDGADPFAAVPVYRHGDLSDMRGRFVAGGYVMELGANVRTFLDDIPVLETVFSLEDGGFVSHSTVPAAVSASPPAGFRLVTGDAPGARIVDLAPPGLDLSGFADADGVAVTDDSGFAALLHRVAADQIQNVVVTTASEQRLRQELEVNLTIRNFTAIRRATRAGLLVGRLARSGP